MTTMTTIARARHLTLALGRTWTKTHGRTHAATTTVTTAPTRQQEIDAEALRVSRADVPALEAARTEARALLERLLGPGHATAAAVDNLAYGMVASTTRAPARRIATPQVMA